MALLYHELSSKIIAACYEVSNSLGAGFLESIYQNALFIVLEEKGLNVVREYPLQVQFRDKVIGQFLVDILVEDKIILELKAVEMLTNIHKAQTINYLKASGYKVGLLVNFGRPHIEIRRFDLINPDKKIESITLSA